MAKRIRKASDSDASGSAARPGRTPPKEYQWGKGQTGNAKGRPRGSTNLATIVQEAAANKVTAIIDGKPRRISTAQATVMQLAAKAAKGDHRSMAKFLEMLDEMETRAAAARPTEYPFSEMDIAVLHELHARMKLDEQDLLG